MISKCPMCNGVGVLVDAKAVDRIPYVERTTIKRFLGICELTPRQLQMIELLAQGRKVREVAKELGLTYGTVKVYLSRDIYKRLGIRTRMELGVWYQTQMREVPAVDIKA